MLASVHRDQGRPTEAVPELKAALALRPGDRAIEEELAVGALRIQKPRRSAAAAGAATGPAGTARTDLAFFYGDALLQAQQVEAALPYLKAAAAGQPDAIVVRASLGRALLQSGDAAAALPHLEAAAAADDPQSDGSAHYQLAQAYQRLGRADQAKRRWPSTRSDRRPCRPRPRRPPHRAGRADPSLDVEPAFDPSPPVWVAGIALALAAMVARSPGPDPLRRGRRRSGVRFVLDHAPTPTSA